MKLAQDKEDCKPFGYRKVDSISHFLFRSRIDNTYEALPEVGSFSNVSYEW